MQHGDTGSPPACKGAAVSPSAALPSQQPCCRAPSGAGAGSLLSITRGAMGGLERLMGTIQVVP